MAKMTHENEKKSTPAHIQNSLQNGLQSNLSGSSDIISSTVNSAIASLGLGRIALQTTDELVAQATEVAENISERSADYYRRARSYVAQNPIRSIAVVVTAGLAAAAVYQLIRRNRV